MIRIVNDTYSVTRNILHEISHRLKSRHYSWSPLRVKKSIWVSKSSSVSTNHLFDPKFGSRRIKVSDTEFEKWPDLCQFHYFIFTRNTLSRRHHCLGPSCRRLREVNSSKIPVSKYLFSVSFHLTTDLTHYEINISIVSPISTVGCLHPHCLLRSMWHETVTIQLLCSNDFPVWVQVQDTVKVS